MLESLYEQRRNDVLTEAPSDASWPRWPADDVSYRGQQFVAEREGRCPSTALNPWSFQRRHLDKQRLSTVHHYRDGKLTARERVSEQGTSGDYWMHIGGSWRLRFIWARESAAEGIVGFGMYGPSTGARWESYVWDDNRIVRIEEQDLDRDDSGPALYTLHYDAACTAPNRITRGRRTVWRDPQWETHLHLSATARHIADAIARAVADLDLTGRPWIVKVVYQEDGEPTDIVAPSIQALEVSRFHRAGNVHNQGQWSAEIWTSAEIGYNPPHPPAGDQLASVVDVRELMSTVAARIQDVIPPTTAVVVPTDAELTTLPLHLGQLSEEARLLLCRHGLDEY